jgi:hypothetical protein
MDPFPANSDRCSPEWLDIVPVFRESGTGYSHVRKTNRATGQTWMCIESPGGRLLADFSLGMPYSRVTLIRRAGDEGRELGRETYGMSRDNEPQERIEFAKLKALIEAGVRSGKISLFSREEALNSDTGATRVRHHETVWDEHGRPLGETTATDEYSAKGGLISSEVGNMKTDFDPSGPVAAPLSTADKRTGEPASVYTVDLIGKTGGRTRVVNEGRPVGFWHKLKSAFRGRR